VCSSDLSPRIVNGVSATIADTPYQVQVAPNYSIDGEYICGGSLIALDWVLTAAHCVEPRQGQSLSVTVYAGSANLYAGTPRVVSEVYVHPNYGNGFSFINDLALLKLTSPYSFTPNAIEPIALPDSDLLDLATFPEISSTALTSGWGTTSFNGSISFVLQKAAITILSNLSSRCGSYTNIQFYPQVMICANGGVSPNIVDSCQGDSGGPLIVQDSGVNFLVGVTSFGFQCALADYPGVYTRVSSFLPWIIPATPTDFTGVYSNDSISLSASFPVSPASPVNRVDLYRSVDGSDFSLLQSFDFTSDFSYVDDDAIVSDSTYQYRLAYVNSISESNISLQKYGVSPLISASTPSSQPPPAAPETPSVPVSPPASIPSSPSPPSVSPGGGAGGGGSLHALTELRPSSGSVSGNYLVSLIGFGFSTVREVKFGGVSVPFILRSDSHIEVNLPTFPSPGPVDVQVILAPNVGSALAPSGFLLLPDSPSKPPTGSNPDAPTNPQGSDDNGLTSVSIKSPNKDRVLSSNALVVSTKNSKNSISRTVPSFSKNLTSAKVVSIRSNRNTRLSFKSPTSSGVVFLKIGKKYVKLGTFTNASSVTLPALRVSKGFKSTLRITSPDGSYFIKLVSK
jgi:secreted trypsin-like serine protease